MTIFFYYLHNVPVVSIVNANESEPIQNQKYFQFGKNSVPVESHKIPN